MRSRKETIRSAARLSATLVTVRAGPPSRDVRYRAPPPHRSEHVLLTYSALTSGAKRSFDCSNGEESTCIDKTLMHDIKELRRRAVCCQSLLIAERVGFQHLSLHHHPFAKPLSAVSEGSENRRNPVFCGTDPGLRNRNEHRNLSPNGGFSPRPGARDVLLPIHSAWNLQH